MESTTYLVGRAWLAPLYLCRALRLRYCHGQMGLLRYAIVGSVSKLNALRPLLQIQAQVVNRLVKLVNPRNRNVGGVVVVIVRLRVLHVIGNATRVNGQGIRHVSV